MQKESPLKESNPRVKPANTNSAWNRENERTGHGQPNGGGEPSGRRAGPSAGGRNDNILAAMVTLMNELDERGLEALKK